MQFTKRAGPQPAMGAPTAAFSTLPSPVVNEDLSASGLAGMIADLQKDPTSALLLNAGTTDTTPNAVPRNPFRMSRTWFTALNPTTPPPITPTPAVAQPKPAPLPTAPDRPAALRDQEFRLTAILGTSAIVNGKVVQAGAIIGRARVLEIRPNAVILQPTDSRTAPTLELALPSSLDAH
jgi:hypothetical protein